MTSAMTITTTTLQNSGGLALPLCIFLTLLAVDAETRMRERIEAFVCAILPAIVALAESLGRTVEPSQRLIEMPEEATFLAGEQERLLTLHRVSSLVCHVEGVSAQIPVSTLRGRTECLVIMPELLEDALSLVHQSLLEMLEHFFCHR